MTVRDRSIRWATTGLLLLSTLVVVLPAAASDAAPPPRLKQWHRAGKSPTENQDGRKTIKAKTSRKKASHARRTAYISPKPKSSNQDGESVSPKLQWRPRRSDRMHWKSGTASRQPIRSAPSADVTTADLLDPFDAAEENVDWSPARTVGDDAVRGYRIAQAEDSFESPGGLDDGSLAPDMFENNQPSTAGDDQRDFPPDLESDMTDGFEDIGTFEDEGSSVTERKSMQEECQVAQDRLRKNLISTIDLDITVTREPDDDYPVPIECSVGSDRYEPRNFAETTYTWKASALCHKPLYFEEQALERYGHSKGPFIQPFASGAHFFTTLPILPYKMGLKTPSECVYALGHYRAGDCAPYLCDPLPLSWRAALFQAGATTGTVFLLP